MKINTSAQPTTSLERAYDHIKEKIINLEFKPSQKLPAQAWQKVCRSAGRLFAKPSADWSRKA